MHAIVHGGCTDTLRESALKVDSGRKIPCRTGESNLRQRRVGLMLYKLSYVPVLLATSVTQGRVLQPKGWRLDSRGL